MLHVYKRNVAVQQLYSFQEEQLETLDKNSQQLVHITSALVPLSMTGAQVS